MNYPGSLHNHTEYSNLRLRDCIIKYTDLIDYAIELGHKCVAITDHEAVSVAIKAQKYYKKIKENNPDFKLILGNEIYLCRDGLLPENFVKGEDKYWHFILLAKDAIGHQQIREISTRAWKRSWMNGKMRRVPTYYKDLEEIIGTNPGHVIASTACLGGFLPHLILLQLTQDQVSYQGAITKWIDKMVNIFGEEDFYLELQPPANKNNEQDIVNQYLVKLGRKYIITTDSHYLKKEDASIHEAYLNSQDGDREIKSFYATTYMMGTEELESYFAPSGINMQKAYSNIQEIIDKCEDYSLEKDLVIPQLAWKDTSLSDFAVSAYFDKIPALKNFMNSDFEGDRRLVKLLVERIINDITCQNEATYKAVDECLNMTMESSIVNNTHWSAYFLNLQKIVETCWEAGTLVGCGRGSGVGFILLYLLGITQINPIRETTQTFPWRFLNPARVSVLDVDIDIEGSQRNAVLRKLREVYGQERVSNVITFGTEKGKSAILTAARGLGIDVDDAQYIAGLIPSDRGIPRTLKQCYYGDIENGYTPIALFVKEMDNNPELWNVAQKIEGLVCRMGIHAGGVIFVDEEFTNSASLMRAPDNTIITAYDLHDSESTSLIKMDLLSVEALDKIHICLDLLEKYGYIKHGTLKERYESVIGIYNIDRTNPKMWDMVHKHEILSLFQMEKQSGLSGIDILKPTSVDDLAVLNSTIRLMAQEGSEEMPTEKLARFKKNPAAWDNELKHWGLGKKEKEILEPVLKSSYGLCIAQEQFMSLVQLDELGGFDLTWADKLRKSIAKKNPKEFDALTNEYYKVTKSKGIKENFAKYVWQVLISMSKGYGFNQSHTLAYSLIGLQEMTLAHKFPIIFWNCANLISDSGALENNSKEEIVDIYEPEAQELSEGTTYTDLPDRSGKIKKTSSTDYEKVAKAIGKMKDSGVIIRPVDINKSDFTFVPDVENNVIWFGLKGLLNVNDELATAIVNNRPYTSIKDFYNKIKPKRQAMISLIKAGAFDSFMNRYDAMIWYIWNSCDKKSRITLQNLPGLIKYNLLPEDTEERKMARRIYEFNRYLKAICKYTEEKYKLDERAIAFLDEISFAHDLTLDIKEWEKFYKKEMDIFRDWIADKKDVILESLNNQIFLEDWNKTIKTKNLSAWEMETMCFYYHAHELSEINIEKYGVADFNRLTEVPAIERTFSKGGKTINIYQLKKICGTCIAKDKAKATVSLLTTSGVVNIKMSKELFSLFDKQISTKNLDGSKTILEKSWFNRGSMIIVTGIRMGDEFKPKKYASSNEHLLYKIDKVLSNGNLVIRSERYSGIEEDDSDLR